MHALMHISAPFYFIFLLLTYTANELGYLLIHILNINIILLALKKFLLLEYNDFEIDNDPYYLTLYVFIQSYIIGIICTSILFILNIDFITLIILLIVNFNFLLFVINRL